MEDKGNLRDWEALPIGENMVRVALRKSPLTPIFKVYFW
jgi:hypothetical protein